ncbi:MAG: hypothetical protein K6F50_07385 [Kiritimatiellae bacterium]|nr:hypothetical protein [Kiritimatiellia bacterium]
MGARNLLIGADEIELFKSLFVDLSLERCGMDAVRRISGALRSAGANELYAFFEDVYSRRLAGDGTSFGLQNNTSNFGDQDKNVLVILLETTDALLGKNDNYEYVYDLDVADALPDADWAPGALSNLYRRTEKSGKEQHDAFVNGFVGGKGLGRSCLKTSIRTTPANTCSNRSRCS